MISRRSTTVLPKRSIKVTQNLKTQCIKVTVCVF
uniref:Uncharacterized protein n=1 Tax=virus sp. ctiha2 TaxID=2827299 RepID=A0A8S5RH79_9VIRU|nr:MAG TPA: hypothetical protein [virus sp. ctiha2]DAX97715.1 MAG TPA: hypothetical protein [Caudoviricetes sp.]